ncbi:MAG: class IV adenylate cyclase [candidate division KSB1 bacterium]|nr:class IV adenylate cyclase [candidate division KSB1 bacterium]MDZ7345385.1 class IV adenylate cyclase [candidate division KSB1 bacterium]
MKKNIEVKALYADLERAEKIACAIGATFQWRKRQSDIYWQTPQGRLKLRLQEGDPAQLIAYRRSCEPGPRPSEYEIFFTDQPQLLQGVLSNVLVQDIVVEKMRTLLLWKNVRIHLDQVRDLGNFIEFEAVINSDSQQATKHVEWLLQQFSISPSSLIDKGYYELLKEGKSASQTQGVSRQQ